MRSLLLLLITTLLLSSCETSSVSQDTLEKFVPRKAAVVITTDNVKGLLSSIQNNEFITKHAATALYTSVIKQKDLLDPLDPEGETLFCFTKLGRDDYDLSLITRVHENLFKGDSSLIKEARLNEKEIKTLGEASHYLIYNEVLIASTSRLLLENIIREDAGLREADPLFSKAYASASASATATLFLRGSEGASLYNDIFPTTKNNPLKDAFSWIAADVDLSQNDIRLNGVVLVQDSTELRLNLLKKTTPLPNRISEITPLSATEIATITYQNWEDFKVSKADFLQMDSAKLSVDGSELFGTFTEIGLITLPKGKAIATVSADVTMSQNALINNDKIREYRKVPIYNYEKVSAFAKAFEPLLNLPPVKVYTQLDDFFIFAEKQEYLETIIANYQNKATLAQSQIFKNTASQLSDASSFLSIKNLESSSYQNEVSEVGKKILKDITLEGYQYAATQLIQEDNYLLYNTVLLKNEETSVANGVIQVANVKLSAAIMTEPQLVKNHRTNGRDIVVQDINNTLYLISNSGKVLWQKDLDGKILGPIQQVDLYRNGRLQLAFTTGNSFYILDRNGKEVAPYPLSFNDEITQPLAIFDYDKNRKYRFVIVQNDEILMYNSAAKPVNGFTFTKAQSPAVFAPTHVRMDNKDYILIAENSGKLNILSRTGQSRITVDKRIDFGDVPIFKNGNSFQTFDINGNKITINTSGKLSETISDYSSDSKIDAEGYTVAGIRENELVIGKKRIKIPFGTYIKPRVITVGNKKYTAITNTEANEVTLYNSNGKALPNFPVYGISRADVGYLEQNKNLGFVIQGDTNSILIYRIN